MLVLALFFGPGWRIGEAAIPGPVEMSDVVASRRQFCCVDDPEGPDADPLGFFEDPFEDHLDDHFENPLECPCEDLDKMRLSRTRPIVPPIWTAAYARLAGATIPPTAPRALGSSPWSSCCCRRRGAVRYSSMPARTSAQSSSMPARDSTMPSNATGLRAVLPLLRTA